MGVELKAMSVIRWKQVLGKTKLEHSVRKCVFINPSCAKVEGGEGCMHGCYTDF